MESQASISGNGLAAARKLAGAPISWGVCEVPGWGRMFPPDRVLGEMASLGLTATELGPLGYLDLAAGGNAGGGAAPLGHLPLDADRIGERL
jgi:hypothetical protein